MERERAFFRTKKQRKSLPKIFNLLMSRHFVTNGVPYACALSTVGQVKIHRRSQLGGFAPSHPIILAANAHSIKHVFLVHNITLRVSPFFDHSESAPAMSVVIRAYILSERMYSYHNCTSNAKQEKNRHTIEHLQNESKLSPNVLLLITYSSKYKI